MPAMIQFCTGVPRTRRLSSTLSTTIELVAIFIALLPIKDPLARDFYAEMCRIERWDVRTLRQKIGNMLFQRTALSKKPEAVIAAEIGRLRDGQMSPDIVFRDPYLLDLLGLKGAYSERDLESAILREIEGVYCWNWASASPSSPGKSASVSARTIFTSICCSSTATCTG
jgi:hypothetical protein